VQANYAVIVPDAHRYDSVQVKMAGYTFYDPSEIYALVIKPNGAPDLVGFGDAPTWNSWFDFGIHSAAGYVNQVGRLRFAVGVSNSYGAPSDLDINSVQVKVKYTVIA
jgi:hypothetical protein